ncbi:hypothetical protein ACFYVL_29240 [Streptomyces sp. NPDC004111]|uniref:hypothetical protein n=1 Tax=Streptomyces sp. NPDC004111 TaxID=3364690 RepID=UPI0036CE3200
MTPAPAAPAAHGPVTMRALLASCAAATAVSTPPRGTDAADEAPARRATGSEKGAVERRDAA